MPNIFKCLVIALVAAARAAPVADWSWDGTNANSSPSATSTGPMSTVPTSSSSTSSITMVYSRTSSATPSALVDPQKKLAEELRTKITAVDRFKALFTNADSSLKTGDDLKKQTTFDFNSAKPAAGEFGGHKAAATVDKFPALTGMGLSTTVAFLSPCGMNTPHVHPRGNEFLTVVNGTVNFGMALENGIANEITGELNAFQGTVFPQGSIHYQFNPSCEGATFVATLNNEDAGTNQVAQGFFGLNGDVVAAATGFQTPISGKDLENFRSKIPISLAKGIESCLTKCKISKN